ncbi:angiopoietin-2 isoform X2 [Pipra filicauda]|uniref:Angiopoietin-2 isoform X2 n=2 Tax=Pipridae TaxID=114313 RepID=A0A6J0H7P5_9PASS|nr:PREDICTED: angiopoietin-2 isoform X2 [Lepidothrix coronata]XP_027546074.1 angiopoietin-2 isoform X2 [Neopelma chrysocephalum]XP_027571296.1 angiopoietin-2 isoform X2 [Pipra filicauda]
MQLAACFFLGCGIFLASGYNSFSKSMETIGKKQYQVQHGSCSYTFLLPETDNCRSSTPYVSNAVQRDAPLDYDDSVQRLQLLENIMENNTQWLMKVLNQTTRLELQLLEHSLSTNKLERQISDQTNEITKLQEKNSFLEKRVLEMEDKHTLQLKSIKDEKDQLQVLVSRQNSIIEELEKQLVTATVNNSVLQKQQHDLMETVHNLLTMISTPNSKNNFIAKEEQISFKDCAEAFKSGLTTSGIYTLTVSNTAQEKKAYCDMETGGGGWTVIQRREDGSVDFHRTWKEYKMGFGDPAGEYWLGNEFVSQLTNQKRYVLKIHLKDWEGNEAYSLYDHFSLASEELKYRIYLKGLTGTAGKISSISQPGNDFSTKDADNDKCICKCSQMLTGGWWFDACGPSNLNGMYYPLRQNNNKFNGIKWYYWKGSGYSLKATTMMIRPADF